MISNPSSFDGDDLDLLSKFVDHKNPEAIRILFRKHRPVIFGICRRYFRCQADADDALQEVFLTLMAHAPSIHSNVGGWLSRCTANICASMIRSRQSQIRRELEHSRLSSPADDDSQWALFLSQLPESLSQLDPIDHGILLQNAQGTTQREIASSLGISQQAVAKRLDKALTRVRRHLISHIRVASCFAAVFLFAKRVACAAIPQALRNALVPSLGTTSGTLKVCTAAALATTLVITCEYATTPAPIASLAPSVGSSTTSLPPAPSPSFSRAFRLAPVSANPLFPVSQSPVSTTPTAFVKPSPSSYIASSFNPIQVERPSETSPYLARHATPVNPSPPVSTAAQPSTQFASLPVPAPGRRIVLTRAKPSRPTDPVQVDPPETPTLTDITPPTPATSDQHPVSDTPSQPSTPATVDSQPSDTCHLQLNDSIDGSTHPHFSHWFTITSPTNAADFAADIHIDFHDSSNVSVASSPDLTDNQALQSFLLSDHFHDLVAAQSSDLTDTPHPHWHSLHIGAGGITPVPEPSSLLLLSVASLTLLRRRRK